MSRNAKVSVGLIALFLTVVAVIALASGGNDAKDSDRAAAAPPMAVTTSDRPLPRVVNSDPRQLGRAGRTGVTFTEFLDFECEGCRAAFPAVEELRKTYAGRVTFNVRYFPIPSHRNSRVAAVAVEAAAQQDKLESMYRKMYETQSEWGEKSDSQAAVFRDFANDLGLNMPRFDAAVADPATLRRVEADYTAGTALGVQGTPTFFINERKINPQSLEELQNELDVALQGS